MKVMGSTTNTDDLQQMYRKQILDVFLRVILLVTTMGLLVVIIIRPDSLLPLGFVNSVLVYTLLLYLLAYLLNRRERYVTSVFTTILTIISASHILSLPLLESTILMPASMIAIFIAGILLSIRQSMLVALFMSIWIYFWSGLLAGESFVEVLLTRLIFIYGVVAMSYGISWYYEQLSKDRRKQDEKYGIIFNASRNALLITDGIRVLERNQLFGPMFGYEKETAPMYIQDVFKDVSIQFDQLNGKDGSTSHEVSLPRANGDRFAAIAHVSNLLEFDPPLYLLSVEDITERKEAEAAHVQLETEKRRVHLLEEFISDASHDLKNPLTTIGTSLYLLRRRHNIPEDSRHMRVVEQEVAHLTNLFDDLLALPRMDSENYMLNTEPTPLADLVRAEVESHRPMANQRAHALAFHPAVTTMPPAMVDRKELARAVRQLITNAIKYTPHGGHIHVRLYSEASFHVIAVEDNGEGIAPEVAALIFERFYRVSGDAIKVTDGLGIGLSIVKRVVEAHNGHVEVESEPGLGSTFRLLLPMEITHHSMPSS